jgi:hypothetical protein
MTSMQPCLDRSWGSVDQDLHICHTHSNQKQREDV